MAVEMYVMESELTESKMSSLLMSRNMMRTEVSRRHPSSWIWLPTKVSHGGCGGGSGKPVGSGDARASPLGERGSVEDSDIALSKVEYL